MKIYVASSWRNNRQQLMVEALRAAGHDVYDFRYPAPRESGFHWGDIDPKWREWTEKQYVEALNSPRAEKGFKLNINALQSADAVVMVQPCGQSIELGWASGAGKITVVLLAEKQQPELMFKLASHICLTIDEVVAILGLHEQARRS